MELKVKSAKVQDGSGLEAPEQNPDMENEANEMSEFEQIKDKLLAEDIQGALAIVEQCISEHKGMGVKEPAKEGLARPSFDEAVKNVLNK